MPSPCEHKEVIAIIREDLKEVKIDVKNILAFQNKIFGIVLAVTVALQFIGFILSTFIK